MRNVESPYLSDLFVISLRWLVLFGLSISLGVGRAFTLKGGMLAFLLLITTLALPALWNGFVTVLAIFNRRLIWHRWINVTLDVIFCLLLLAGADGFRQDIFWAGLLPVFSAAIYFEARGALGIAVLTSILQAALAASAAFFEGGQFAWGMAAVVTGFNLIAGVISALLSAPLLTTLRHTYQGTVNQRREGERKVQRQERDRMQGLFSMVETFSSTLNYKKVIETIVETAIEAVDDDNHQSGEMVGCVLLFGSQQDLEMHAARGFAAADLSARLPARKGILYETLKSDEPRILQDPSSDPELGSLVTLQQRQSAACLPLIRGFHADGVMLFAHPNPDFFTPERIEAIQMLSHQAVIALQNARLYQDLAHEKERIVRIQEDAQKKLARDLHDGPTQSLSAIAMRIHIVRKLLEIAQKSATLETMQSSQAEMRDELIKIEELAQRTTQEIRHMLFTLRPLVLESEGLEATLKTMADKISELYQQNVLVEIAPGMVDLLDSTRQSIVFYLAEEAVNNARKHAHAEKIRVKLALMPGENCIALLEIIDNGVGFNVDTVMSSYDRRGSLGMINLRERAELINGLLKIESAPGNGTRIQIYIPLSDQAVDRLLQLRQ